MPRMRKTRAVCSTQVNCGYSWAQAVKRAFAGRWLLPQVLIGVLSLCHGRNSRAELATIWAVDDGTKVRQNELHHPLQQGNGIFSLHERRVRLFGLRNEIISFQLILQGGHEDTPAVSVRLPSLGGIANGPISDDPDSYYLHRFIEIFEETYLTVQVRSGEDLPPELIGPVPDPLVPHRRPLTVRAGQNQAFWVDLYLPPRLTPGLHAGELLIEVGGKVCDKPACRLRLELEVLPQALPDRPTIKTMLFFSGSARDSDQMLARYLPRPQQASAAEIAALRSRHFKLARRHRVTLFNGIDENTPDEALRQRLSGQSFTRAAGYEGPGEAVGQDLYSIHTYGGRLTHEEADLWSTWFCQHGPGVEYFLYVQDEPGDAKVFPRINSIARQARPVPSLVTARWQPGLDVDIYTTSPRQLSVKAARQAAARGKRIWIYNGQKPYCGSFVIDDAAISTRVNPWIQYKYGLARWFYWESTYYNNFQDNRGQTNIWRQALTFSNRGGDQLNGDGVLFYPGRDQLFPGEDRGLDLPLPSIRLKNWRRGIQDVEYLVLLRQAGQGPLVQHLLNTMIPRALADETDDFALPSWPEDGERWLQARRLLFLALKSPASPHPALSELARPTDPWTSYLQRLIHRFSRSRNARWGLGLLVVMVWGGWSARRWRAQRRARTGRR
jgi:hypothetical protein